MKIGKSTYLSSIKNYLVLYLGISATLNFLFSSAPSLIPTPSPFYLDLWKFPRVIKTNGIPSYPPPNLIFPNLRYGGGGFPWRDIYFIYNTPALLSSLQNTYMPVCAVSLCIFQVSTVFASRLF